ncbi:Pyrimidine-specific ribonucleoside hydrolase rihB [Anaerotruncus sp. 2789STDY5834896]|uniref:Pyrimidine-specific ribonucleoside hydrolase rihB n=1 Tax=uncultured Anaerotruncus sp. TaxID=905011 RepID=A0A1C6JFK1_9FIRM|nr:Pyrimidine-specific ribonucleoside hydrolase rihB [uncultured Anaerotruncus sp.]
MREKLLLDIGLTPDLPAVVRLCRASKQHQLQAVTAVYGRQPVQDACRALQQCLGGPDGVPVYLGAAGPLFGEYRFAAWPDPEPQDTWAWDAIYRAALAAGGDIQLLAAGPLTNLAIFIKKYHDQRHLIKKITVLGGARKFGDAGPYSEFGLWADPLAAQIVLESDIPYQFIGLDPVIEAGFTAADLAGISRALDLPAPRQKHRDWLDYTTPDPIDLAKAIAAAAYLHPETAAWQRFHAEVEVLPGPCRGRLLLHEKANFDQCFDMLWAQSLNAPKLLKVLGAAQ